VQLTIKAHQQPATESKPDENDLQNLCSFDVERDDVR
jgi:hypothetical protein